MAPIYNLNHVTEVHPFMTCLVKVDTRRNWQKTIAGVLNKCHGVYNFRVDDNGIVEISGVVDPKVLLKKLGRSGRKAELQWFQFGECSNNLFMSPNHNEYGGSNCYHDGRYLQAHNVSRPKVPSHDNIIRPSAPYIHKHDYNHHFHQQHYDHNHGCYQDRDQGYGHHGCFDHDHGYGHHGYNSPYYGRNNGYKLNDDVFHFRPTRDDDDMACCIIM